MDFKKSKVLLKKINAIYESGEAFNHQFSSLEKDLLLQYLRDFYECITTSKEEEKSANNGHQVENRVTVSTKEDSKKVRNEVETQPAVKKVTEVVSSSNGVHAQQEVQESSVSVKDPEEAEPSVDADVAELFLFDEHQDLSNRFANRPINDVAKAMGINERILTINELFGGDQQAFLSIVNRLNNSENFNDAKNILQNDVIKRFDWTKNSRQKKAKIFIQLVKRRFL